MKKILSAILAYLVLFCLCATAFAAGSDEAPQQNITEEKTESGGTIITVDNGEGHVFTIEELPEYEEKEIIVIETPEPTQEPTAEPSATEEVKTIPAETEMTQPQAETAKPTAWPYITGGFGAVAVVCAALVLSKKKKK